MTTTKKKKAMKTEETKPDDQLKRLQADLEQRLQEALERCSSSSAHDSVEFIDMASDNEADEMQVRIAEAAANQLDQIYYVMDKLKEGTYGVCEECGKKIPVARLRIIPFATKCVPCKELEEQEAGLSGRRYRPPVRPKLVSTDDEEEVVSEPPAED